MKLMTKQLEKRFREIGSQKNAKNPIIVAKFFDPLSWVTWYATEYKPDSGVFFGYVKRPGGYIDQWESFSLDELRRYKSFFVNGIERDLSFEEKKASEEIQPPSS